MRSILMFSCALISCGLLLCFCMIAGFRPTLVKLFYSEIGTIGIFIGTVSILKSIKE